MINLSSSFKSRVPWGRSGRGWECTPAICRCVGQGRREDQAQGSSGTPDLCSVCSSPALGWRIPSVLWTRADIPVAVL